MFAVDDILISDAVLDAPFTCNLGACHGACCVVGAGGAPLEPEERQILEAALPVVQRELRPEALATIAEKGVWVEESAGEYATTCVGNDECVFVIYDGPVAKCALQKAYYQGRLDFEKPVSCHLFPIRIEQVGETTVLNYEQIDLCRPGVNHGQRLGVQLADFLEHPLTRRFGEDWYHRFRKACHDRVADLAAAME